MRKEFFEVFPTLKFNKDLHELLLEVEVSKITSTSDKSFLRIYIESKRLIQKKLIYQIENEIKKQIFQDSNISIKIIERYELSKQYTPKTLLEVYKDSILLEFKNYSLIEYNLLRKAESDFIKEDILQLKLEDGIIARTKSDELKRILEKIFVERCGFPMEIRFLYEEPVENKRKKQDELRMEMEATEIVKQSSFADSEEDVIVVLRYVIEWGLFTRRSLTKNQIIQMYFMEEILMKRLFQLIILWVKWEKL